MASNFVEHVAKEAVIVTIAYTKYCHNFILYFKSVNNAFWLNIHDIPLSLMMTSMCKFTKYNLIKIKVLKVPKSANLTWF